MLPVAEEPQLSRQRWAQMVREVGLRAAPAGTAKLEASSAERLHKEEAHLRRCLEDASGVRALLERLEEALQGAEEECGALRRGGGCLL